MHFTVQPFSILFPFSCICSELVRFLGFPHSSVGKESICNAGDPVSIPGWGRCPGEGNGNPLQYSCLGNPVVRGTWPLHSMGSQKSQTQLSNKFCVQCADLVRLLLQYYYPKAFTNSTIMSHNYHCYSPQ